MNRPDISLSSRLPSRDQIPHPGQRGYSRFKDLDILKKLGVSAAIVLLVIAGFGGIITNQTSNLIQDSTQAELKNNADSQALQAKTWMNSMTRQTQMASTAVTQYEQGTQLNSYLSTLHQNTPNEVTAIHVVNTKTGTITGSTVSSFTGKQISKTNLDSKTLKQKQFTSLNQVTQTEIYTSPNTGSNNGGAKSIALFSPTDTKNELVVTVINLQKASLQFRAPANGRVMVAGMDGTVLFSTNRNLIGTNIKKYGITDSSAWKTAVKGSYRTTTYSEKITMNGEQQVTALMSVDSHNLVTISQRPADAAYFLRNKIRTLIGALIIGSVLSIGLVVGILGLDLVRVTRGLRDYANKVADGKYEADADIDRSDEFGELYKAVNDMGTSLKARIDEEEEMNRQLEAAVVQQSETLDEVADGDLTKRMETEHEMEQLNDLAENINTMLDDMQASIEQAKKFSARVEQASEEVSAGVEDIDQASGEVAEATQEIQDGAETQSQQLDQVTNELSDLSTAQEQVASSADQLADQAEHTNETAREGRAAAQTASAVLQNIEDETDQAVDAIQDLSDEMRNIEEVVSFISNVAKQTNMLAINAGIEAANQGSNDGDGFGVVAEEVKELADDVSDAANEIEESLQHLQEKTDSTAQDIKTAQQTVEEGTKTIEDALSALDKISEAVSDTAEGVREIDGATETQAETVDGIVESVGEVTSISEETAAQSEDVAAAAEEQSASVRQVNQSVQNFADSASQLSDLLDQFEVSQEYDVEEVAVETQANVLSDDNSIFD